MHTHAHVHTCLRSLSRGGAARITGALHLGDQIMSINDMQLEAGMDPGNIYVYVCMYICMCNVH